MSEMAATGGAVLVAEGVRYRYRRTEALRGIDLAIPRGATYALIGPNGSGKSTLLHVLLGLRAANAGRARILGRDSRNLGVFDRQRIGYVGEGQQLPRGMRIAECEAFLRPLYPAWDVTLAAKLRARFQLDPARRIGTLSRGEYMKAAMLFALAPHPEVLLMDEPFTGMDVSVKDELVSGLLESAMSDGCTSLVCSHDLAELEPLADWVGFLANGALQLSDSMERVNAHFLHVDLMLDPTMTERRDESSALFDTGWLNLKRSGRHVSFVVPHAEDDFERAVLARRFPDATSVETRPATLREIFVAMSQRSYEGSGGAATTNGVGAAA